MSDTIRVLGHEADATVVVMIQPQVITDATPIASSALDMRSYPRMRCLFVAAYNEVGATAHTVAYTITASATSGGEYTDLTTISGTALTAVSADTTYELSVKWDPARPFVKVTATGSHADVDGAIAAFFVFIADTF